MTTASWHRPYRPNCPQEGLDSTFSQLLTRSINTRSERAKESDRGHGALPCHRLTTHHQPPTIGMVPITVFEPSQSFLKTRVTTPTQLSQSMQHPSRQPWDGVLTLPKCETALARSCFEQHVGRRLKSGIGWIGAPLDGRKEEPAWTRIWPPQRHIDRPASVWMKVFDQRRHRLDRIRTSTGANYCWALRWSPDQIHQNSPVKIRSSLIEQPGKWITA